MHPEAEPQVRDLALTRNTTGEDLPFPAARSETARDEDAVHLLELPYRLLVRHVLGIDPAHANPTARVNAAVLERFVHREIRIVELQVLADQRDLYLLPQLAAPFGELAPLAEVGGRHVEAELLAHEGVETLRLQRLGDEVDVGDVGRSDHGAQIDVREQGDLVADVV